MTELVPINMGAMSSIFANQKHEDDLAAGVQSGFGLITYKGKVWRIKHHGEERIIYQDNGVDPRNSIEVVILKAAGVVSKIYYAAGYVEGSTAAPDCMSTNGLVPDNSAAKKQSQSCANCPQNAWGSRVTPAGKQGKACQDSKRLAVVPLLDIRNEMFGGPLLLRVPAASLRDLVAFNDKLKALGYHYYAIGTRIAFDPNEAFPKFTFGAIRALSDVEAKLVLEMRDGPAVTRILAENDFAPAPQQIAPQITAQQLFEQPPQQLAPPAPAPQPAPQPAPAPVTPTSNPAPAPTSNPAPVATGGFGPMSPPPQTTAAAALVQPVTVAEAPAEAPTVGSSAFEAALDAKLEAILPKV